MLNYWQIFLKKSDRVLLLQGPVGPFFSFLKEHLSIQHKKYVASINFNAGDRYFMRGQHSYDYKDSLENFNAYLDNLVKKLKIDAIVCFGDERFYHKIAREYCQLNSKVRFWAFEEGYLRPHYITFEEGGVNYNSLIAQKNPPGIFTTELSQKRKPLYAKDPRPVAAGFWPRARLAMRYYYEMWRGRSEFSLYQHHREDRLTVYLGAWLKAGILREYYKLTNFRIARKIRAGEFGRFFIFPLQVHNDSQIREHGRGGSMPAYIRSVVNSFALYAPKDCKLVIKHHPMDIGFNNYQRLISRLAKRHNIEGRVIYLHEIPMPDLLRNAAGMVVINSTSGMSALIHRLPVKVIGNAHYDIPEITAQQDLADFWRSPAAPNVGKIDEYLSYLLVKTQINGSFYYLNKLCLIESNGLG